MRDGDAAARAAHRSPVTPFHVGGGCRLVDEHEPVGIKLELAVEPGLPPFPHVGAVLLTRVNSPFLRVMLWRAKKRCSPLVLVATPCSRSMSRNSRRYACGRASQVARIRAAGASIPCEFRSPPIGLAVTSPSCRKRAYQRMAVASPTPKRSAASVELRPSDGRTVERSGREAAGSPIKNVLAERILEEDDVRRMLGAEPDRRNKELLMLFYGAGLRRSELCDLTWRDLGSRCKDRGQATVFGKGGKTRTVTLYGGVWSALQGIRGDAGPMHLCSARGRAAISTRRRSTAS